MNKIARVKFSDSYYTTIYSYLIPEKYENIIQIGNFVIVPNGLDKNATGPEQYKIAEVVDIQDKDPQRKATKYIIDIIDDSSYLQERRFRKQSLDRENMIDTIKSYIEKYGGNMHISDVQISQSYNGSVLEYKINIEENNPSYIFEHFNDSFKEQIVNF